MPIESLRRRHRSRALLRPRCWRGLRGFETSARSVGGLRRGGVTRQLLPEPLHRLAILARRGAVQLHETQK